jgi:hypothetical protein
MPPSNSALKANADPSVGGNGCIYSGPTSITLNSDSTMTVITPFTKIRTQVGCAGPATAAGTIAATPVVYTVPLPPNGLAYVQTVPAASGDPNFWSTTATDARCPSPQTSHNALGYPIANDVTTGYGCRDGDVFVRGTHKGQLTIAAEDTIVATTSRNSDGTIGVGNITYDTTVGTTLLGLIANQYVEVYHPVSNAPAELQQRNNITIQAAILSLAHSFIVQNYQTPSIGGCCSGRNLTVFGAIAQKYRGPVGTINNSGYLKDYNYDDRLKFLTPPSWVSPVLNQWRVQTWAELTPQPTPSATP